MLTTQNYQPIGIFDSGVGGLSIAKAVQKRLPNESFIYLADSLYAPYGNLTPEQITDRVNKIAQWFIKKNVKALVIACNTATVNTIDQLRTFIDMPIIGVEPAIKPAVAQSRTKKIAIMVTQATANNERFINLVNKHKHNTEVYIQACPGLVEIIEADDIESYTCHSLLRQYLAPIMPSNTSNIDTLVLGCTHYPFLHEKICSIIGDKITLMETSVPVVKQLEKQLLLQGINADVEQKSDLLFFSTQDNKQQEKVFSYLLGKNVTVKNITI